MKRIQQAYERRWHVEATITAEHLKTLRIKFCKWCERICFNACYAYMLMHTRWDAGPIGCCCRFFALLFTFNAFWAFSLSLSSLSLLFYGRIFCVVIVMFSLSLRYLNPLPSSQHYSTYSIENIPLIFDKLVFISGPFRVFWLDFHSASFLSTYFFFRSTSKAWSFGCSKSVYVSFFWTFKWFGNICNHC